MPSRLPWMLLLGLWTCATAPAPSAPSGSPTPQPGRPLAMPGRLIEGRFFVEPVTRDGQPLRFYTDNAPNAVAVFERVP